MYDENDGYFDHLVPPQPPTPVLPGKSTVSTEEEIHDRVNPGHRPLYTADRLAYGLGPRVPMLAISPWSKGGHVCSQVFDHSSVIRFIEARFGVAEPNISPWRRAVCGDLTTMFDFDRPDAVAPRLPDTSQYRAKADVAVKTLPVPSVPGESLGIIAQEAGVRPARPLPYALEVTGQITAGGLKLHFANTGRQGASFIVYREGKDDLTPLRYTIGAGAALEDSIALPEGANGIAVHGPNGFYRRFSGAASTLQVIAAPSGDAVRVRLANTGATALACRITDTAYGGGTHDLTVAAGQQIEDAWPIAASHHWYDLTVTASTASWRMSGHVETGKPSFSDPAAVAPVLT